MSENEHPDAHWGVLTGDFLFVSSAGRPDLLGKAQAQKVVAHGKGIGMLLAKTSTGNVELKTKIEKPHAAGVKFAACENTMIREKLDKKDLVALSTTVNSGVSEVIRKQELGYAYIKSGG